MQLSHKEVNLDNLPDFALQTTTQRIEHLENLLYYKVNMGEDISSCIQALNYFNSNKTTQQQLQEMWTEVTRERSVFNTVQRVVFVAFSILGMIALLNGAFKSIPAAPALMQPDVNFKHQSK